MKKLLILSVLFISISCSAQKKDYWIIYLDIYPRYDTTQYFNYMILQHGKYTGLPIRDIMNGFTSSEVTTYGKIKKYLIAHTMSFRKEGEPVYLVGNTHKKIRIK